MPKELFWQEGKAHILIDPDKWTVDQLREALKSIPDVVGSLVVGGTYIADPSRFEPIMHCCLESGLPVGNVLAVGLVDSVVSPSASYVLVPVILQAVTTQYVTQHLLRAIPILSKMRVPVIPYAYVMLSGGVPTSAEFFTQTIPVPRDKPEVLTVFTQAAQFLGLQGIYLEAGSGARDRLTKTEVEAVRSATNLPIAVGGGISSMNACSELFHAGATCVVIGSEAERKKSLSWLN